MDTRESDLSVTGVVELLLLGAPRFLGTIFFIEAPVLGSLALEADAGSRMAFSWLSTLPISDLAGLDPMLFLGLPLAFLGVVAAFVDRFCVVSSMSSCVVFFRPTAFGFGVPFLFTGPSKDFLGLPLPRFAAGGLEPAASFKGTVVVIVRASKRFEGESGIVFSGSASTVTLIRQGLTTLCALALDLVGDEEGLRRGVVR